MFGEGTKLIVIPSDRRFPADISPKPTIFLPSIAEINLQKAGTYLCLLENFFPDVINVYWKEKNGNTILESQQGKTMKTNDTYMKFSWLTVTEKSMDKEHKCIIQHENNKRGVDQEILFPSVNEVVTSVVTTIDSTTAYPKDESIVTSIVTTTDSTTAYPTDESIVTSIVTTTDSTTAYPTDESIVTSIVTTTDSTTVYPTDESTVTATHSTTASPTEQSVVTSIVTTTDSTTFYPTDESTITATHSTTASPTKQSGVPAINSTKVCLKDKSHTLKLQLSNTSAYYTYLLLLLKSVVYFAIVTFSLFRRTAVCGNGKSSNRWLHKEFNFSSLFIFRKSVS